MPNQTDPVDLTAQLVRCQSVTPAEGGAIALLDRLLTGAGFQTRRVDRGGIANLFARWGAAGNGRAFGFNGHTDVVPVGNRGDWSHDPFAAEIVDGKLWGRGAVDMKSGVAAFVAAAIDFTKSTPPEGSIIITITGDEEAEATDGTVAILQWMAKQGERMDVCLVGEPTCPSVMGEMIKIGRRGSMNVVITARGVQGHSAYPGQTKNPVVAMARLIDILARHELDKGTANFDPSTLAVTSFDTGNTASNVIPASCSSAINIRFNDAHSSASLAGWLKSEATRVEVATGVTFTVRASSSGESFLTPPGDLSALVVAAVKAETGREPELSTSGGTSDARFVRAHCPVVEFGLVGTTMHKVDEHVEVAHILQLKAIYARILSDYFAS